MAKPQSQPQPAEPTQKASLRQVVATLFWGLCMIGKRDTWERDGVIISLKQAIIGAVIAGCLIVTLLIVLARFAVR